MKSSQNLRIARTGHKTAKSGVFSLKSDFGGRGTPQTDHYSKFPEIFWNFLKFPNFRGTKIIFFNKNTPELGVSGIALTILKIWAKNIKFEESYGESKLGSETLYVLAHLSPLRGSVLACSWPQTSQKLLLFWGLMVEIDHNPISALKSAKNKNPDTLCHRNVTGIFRAGILSLQTFSTV